MHLLTEFSAEPGRHFQGDIRLDRASRGCPDPSNRTPGGCLPTLTLRPDAAGKTRILRVVNNINRNKKDAAPAGKALLHGHCYQKAQLPAVDGFPVGQEASVGVLRPVGYDVQVVPSGCCGMAGAFGYEAEHYDVSMQVGELTLLPAVRKAQAAGIPVSASGTSCRSQIDHGAGVRTQHPLQLIQQLLRS